VTRENSRHQTPERELLNTACNTSHSLKALLNLLEANSWNICFISEHLFGLGIFPSPDHTKDLDFES
jgi:hypothetical protein